jgi:voltage-gated potassium channel
VTGGVLLFGNVTTAVIKYRRKEMKGFGNYSEYSGHTVVMGWQGHRTMRVLTQLVAEDKEAKIVLCSESLDERPVCLPPNIVFVKGLLASEDVMDRSGVRNARSIIINGRNDDETSLATLSVLTYDEGDPATIAVYLENMDNVVHIHRLEKCFHRNISIIRSVSPDLLVKEITDPGFASIFGRLLDESTDRNPYRLDLTKEMPYDAAVKRMWEHHIPVIGAVTEDDKLVIAPRLNPVVKALFVISESRPDFLGL